MNEIENHKGILLKVSRIYFDDVEDQRDLFQEIILQLWKSRSSFKGHSQFSTWLYQVAVNTALVFFKRQKRKPKLLPLAEHDTVAAPAYEQQQERQLAIFYRAVRHLNKVEKALIFLYLEARTGAQMAQTLGLSEGNIRVKLNRTKKKLQKLTEVEDHEI